MKPLLYSVALLVLLGACKHQQSIASSNVNSTSHNADSTSTQTTGWTTTTTQGDVTITTDESTTATIIVTNPPDTEVTTTVAASNTSMPDSAGTIYRLTVAFISKGAGIDYQTEESFENWLKAQPKHPAYEKTHWGREGETNICLKLDELSTREQDIFVRDARTQLADKELVIVTEYAVCKGVKE